MTAQIIFPKQDTYWILSDGTSYFDGFTGYNCVTTVGKGTSVYWIGTDHEEYVNACLNLGLTPRNAGPSPVISLNPDSPLLGVGEKIDELKDTISQMTNEMLSLSTQQQETITKLDPIDANILFLQQKSERVDDFNIENINTRIDSLLQAIPGVRISARQARLWLIQNGVDLNAINSIIDTVEDPVLRESIRTEWEYATYVERSYPWLNALAAQLGLSESDLDRAFIEAALI